MVNLYASKEEEINARIQDARRMAETGNCPVAYVMHDPQRKIAYYAANDKTWNRTGELIATVYADGEIKWS